MHVLQQQVGVEKQHPADYDQEYLSCQIEDREQNVQERRLAHADDVNYHKTGNDNQPADGIPGIDLQEGNEDSQVVRDGECGYGDRDDVPQHERPSREEADQLIEAVTREA